jgi:ABC-type tungstate transport system permease subunit
MKFNKTEELYLSYSTIFGTETLEAIKGGDKDLFNSYAVVMLTVKPNLFKSEK